MIVRGHIFAAFALSAYDPTPRRRLEPRSGRVPGRTKAMLEAAADDTPREKAENAEDRMELQMSRFSLRMASRREQGGKLPRPVAALNETAQDGAVRGISDRRPARVAAAARTAPGAGRSWALGLAALLLAGAGARAQAVFSAQPVGAISGAQSVTVSALAAGAVTQVQVLTLGTSGLDFEKGTGPLACETAIFSAAGQTCTESVTFTPGFPGLRIGAVLLLGSGGSVLGTTYLSGTGSGGLGVLAPGNVLPVAGDGQWVLVHDGNQATQAELNLPAGVTLDGAGNLYIADSLHDRIRKVSAATGIISTVAGNGNPAYTGDGGAALSATLNTPNGVALDGAGNLYIADTGNNAIRKVVAANGIIVTVAGTGAQGSSGDTGAAALAELNQPWGVSLDGAGNLFIADTANHRIRRVDAVTGIITSVAGNGFKNPNGTGGFAGDSGPAASAELNRPFAVAFDLAGNMYIPDSANNRIRMVSTGGVITTFAGTGTVGYAGDGAAANLANLWSPSGVAVDPAGNVYIADTQNNAIRKVSASTGFISAVARYGSGEYFFNGGFSGVNLYGPLGLYLDGSGNLYLADYFNMIVREIQSSFVALDYTKTPVRQGDKSAAKDQSVENDGNAALDLTAITPDRNAALGAATTCATGSPFLAVDADCLIAAVFAPSALVTPTNPESGNIDIAGDTVSGISAPNSPLDIQLVGDATAVNSTTVVLASSLNPSQFGQNVTFTATVTTGQNTGSLTGTVTFLDGATTLAANVTLNASGAAGYTTPALAVGLHTITAAYSGDSLHFPSTSTDNSTPPLIQTVLEGTAVNLSSSLNPSNVGQNVTFTAAVTISGGGGIAPDGSVTFWDGTISLGTVAINSGGVATYSTATFANGQHSITAVYSGDAARQIQGCTSSILYQDVQAPASTALGSAPNPSNYGVPVVFTATVTPTGSVAATGAVNFLDAGTQIGTANLAGATGQAAFTISSLVVGSHTITAAYRGDLNYGPSTSPAVTQVVNQTQTSTVAAALPNPGIAGLTVAITATVRVIAGAATTTGTVTFADTSNGATVSLGSAALAAGTATINPMLAPGSHFIVATYAGDANDNGSVSASLALPVLLATTSTAVTSSSNPAVVQSAVTFTAKVTGNGGIPSGSIGFFADGASIGAANLDPTGAATLSYSGLAAGSHQITAVYSGDVNDSPSTSPAIAQVVGTIPTVTDLGLSATIGANPAVILVAAVLGSSGTEPTGSVTFKSGAAVLGAAPLDSSAVATLTPNLATGSYTVVAVYSGDAAHSPSTSQPITFSTTATGFNFTVTPPSVTVATSQNVSVAVNMTSVSGFADTIGLGCASLPAGVTCHFSNFSVPLAANGTAVSQLTIDTNSPLTGGSSARNSNAGSRIVDLAGFLLPFNAFFGWILWRFRRRHAALLTMVLVLLLSGAALLASGCGGISSSSAAPGAYVIQVTGTGANSNLIHYQNVSLTVTK